MLEMLRCRRRLHAFSSVGSDIGVPIERQTVDHLNGSRWGHRSCQFSSQFGAFMSEEPIGEVGAHLVYGELAHPA